MLPCISNTSQHIFPGSDHWKVNFLFASVAFSAQKDSCEERTSRDKWRSRQGKEEERGRRRDGGRWGQLIACQSLAVIFKRPARDQAELAIILYLETFSQEPANLMNLAHCRVYPTKAPASLELSPISAVIFPVAVPMQWFLSHHQVN